MHKCVEVTPAAACSHPRHYSMLMANASVHVASYGAAELKLDTLTHVSLL